MVRIFLAVSVFLFFAACGKNDGFRSVPNSPYPSGSYPQVPITQAPMPPGGAYVPPTTSYFPSPYGSGYPSGGYGGYGTYGNYPPSFQPQMPRGYPSQYTPFLPIDNYMRQRPDLASYWDDFWRQWMQYAQYNQIDQYDFPSFWFDYCPQEWDQTQFASLYNFYDANTYFWMEPYTEISVEVEQAGFWEYYDGMSFEYLETFDFCYDGCGW